MRVARGVVGREIIQLMSPYALRHAKPVLQKGFFLFF
jgi:hypothetical protein